MTRIGEDVAEKLDYEPGRFSVERHVRGKWACAKCQTLTQAPVPACVIDKGLATAGVMADMVVARYIDHKPLYRQDANTPRPPSQQCDFRCVHVPSIEQSGHGHQWANSPAGVYPRGDSLSWPPLVGGFSSLSGESVPRFFAGFVLW